MNPPSSSARMSARIPCCLEGWRTKILGGVLALLLERELVELLADGELSVHILR